MGIWIIIKSVFNFPLISFLIYSLGTVMRANKEYKVPQFLCEPPSILPLQAPSPVSAYTKTYKNSR